ncbi:MAG: septal ring lytic transglycosylase RlpA family protein [Alphaproteobacteria bacterium]
MRFVKCFSMIFVVFFIGSCSEIELASHVGKKVTGGKVQSQGRYKVGSPYKIKGQKYYPKVDFEYDETGIASWYGPGFHGKSTANGERFDENELTAAHKTLPLPSIVRVTNLENGRSLVVRVNDRGPYAHSRIIDMSKRSAELLGFRGKGIAKVRVQVLEAESRLVEKAARNGHDTSGMEVAMNRPGYKSPQLQQASLQPQQRPSVQKASLHSDAQNTTIPGHVKEGRFYPDPVISEYPVTAHDIFVQVGSFSTREGAMRAASALDSYGRAQVYPAMVKGQQFYRVRFPAADVGSADALISHLIAGGHENALIVVD